MIYLSSVFILCFLQLCRSTSPLGLSFTNWDGMMTCDPLSFSVPSTETEIVDFVKHAYMQNNTVKVIGAGMSFSGIQLTEGGHMLSLQNYNKILNVEHSKEDSSALLTVQAGIQLRHLVEQLNADYGLALENMGATATQSIVGACSTGTHGTGISLGNMASTITQLTVIDSQGRVRTANSQENVELFNAARVGLGAVGVISTVTVRVLPQFKLERRIEPYSLTTLIGDVDKLLSQYDRLQWSFTPYTDEASVIYREEVPMDTEMYPPSPDGGCWSDSQSTSDRCVDLSYKALTDSESHYEARSLYTEMEMFIPYEYTMEAVEAYRAWMDSVKDQHDPSIAVSVMVRYLATDSMSLSPVGWGQGNKASVLSVIVMDSPSEFELYSRGLETLCEDKYAGRAHWGKVNYLDSHAVENLYGEGFKSFSKVREVIDPTGVFMNEYLTTRL